MILSDVTFEVRLITRDPDETAGLGRHWVIEAFRRWVWDINGRGQLLRLQFRPYVKLGQAFPWGARWGELRLTRGEGETRQVGRVSLSTAGVPVLPEDEGKTAYGWVLIARSVVSKVGRFDEPVALEPGRWVFIENPTGYGPTGVRVT